MRSLPTTFASVRCIAALWPLQPHTLCRITLLEVYPPLPRPLSKHGNPL